MLIGGASLYEQTLERADTLYITRIQHAFSGDTWFPDFDETGWVIADLQEFAADENNPYPISFIKFVREFY